jgi:hypothetical protein
MKKNLLFGVAFLILALCALPALAASPEPAASAALAAIFAPAPVVAAHSSLPTKSTSTANCWDGSTVTCTGTSSSAVNSSCPNQRGYCTGTTSGTIYCPVCSTGGGCTATAVCANGSTVSCTGATAGDCFALRNCYADCGGPLVWCPNHPSCPV